MGFAGPATLIYSFYKKQRAGREGSQDEKAMNTHKSSSKPCAHRQPEAPVLTGSSETNKSNNIEGVSSSTGDCAACRTQKRAERNYRLKVIGGLILPFALTSLDTTIIAGALPFIASDFRMISLACSFEDTLLSLTQINCRR